MIRVCTRGTGRTRKAETRIFKLQRGRFSTQSSRRKCGVFLIFSLGPMHAPCDVLRTVACASSIPQRGLHRAGGANSACGRDAGWGAGEAPRPLLTFDPQLTEGFGGRRPRGCVAGAAESGRAAQGRGRASARGGICSGDPWPPRSTVQRLPWQQLCLVRGD